MFLLVKQLLPFIISGVLVAFLILISIPIAKKIGLVDHPGERKKHQGLVPLVGGIAIAVSLSLSILLFSVSFGEFRLLFFCIGLLIIIGILDDQRELRPIYKFYSQFAVALILTLLGATAITYIGDVFATGKSLGLGFLAIPFSIISIIGVINAFNMVDGHDGLAATLTVLGLTALLYLLTYRGNEADIQYSVLIMLLITLLLVFLLFNLSIFVGSNRQVFLGDAGSMFLGLIMVFLLIKLSQRQPPVISTTAAAWLIGVPLLDMVSVITVRLVSRKSILNPDRNHIHHLLNNLGLNKLQVLVLLGILQGIFCFVAVAGTLLEWPDAFMFWGMFPMLLIYYILYVVNRRKHNH